MSRHLLPLGICLALGCPAEAPNLPSSSSGGMTRGSSSGDADDASSSGGGATSGVDSTTAAGACVPGMQVGCACPGGDQGVQVCNPDGTGFGACECPGPTTTSATDGTDTGTGGSCPGLESDCVACQQCALEGECAVPWDACVMDRACMQFAVCLSDCMEDQVCYDACMDNTPVRSVRLYAEVSTCVGDLCPVCVDA